jgi:Tol biopolymer transport system component
MKTKLSNLVQLFSLTVVLGLISPAIIYGQTGKINFSGTWALNTEKSTQQGGGEQRMGGGNLVVAQEANILTKTRTGQDGTARVSKYSLDGKESVNTTGRGESKSIAKWSADGKTLSIETTMVFNGNERTSTEVWSLTDTKTLSVAITRQGPNGEVKSTIVYDKK